MSRRSRNGRGSRLDLQMKSLRGAVSTAPLQPLPPAPRLRASVHGEELSPQLSREKGSPDGPPGPGYHPSVLCPGRLRGGDLIGQSVEIETTAAATVSASRCRRLRDDHSNAE
jgi:hypothetical protein